MVRETTQDYELILVDNGSDPPYPIPYMGFVDVTMVRNEKNLGFPAAVNQGIEASNGDVIVLLNNDVIVTPGWADRLVGHLSPYSIVGPTTNYAAGSPGGEIEVVQTPIDRWGNVVARDVSDGRFIVRAEKHVDPFIFHTGREITISGMLVETQKKMLSGGEETYPVFEAAEIRLRPDDTYYRYPVWREPLYIPYPYYWYDPFWGGPFFYP